MGDEEATFSAIRPSGPPSRGRAGFLKDRDSELRSSLAIRFLRLMVEQTNSSTSLLLGVTELPGRLAVLSIFSDKLHTKRRRCVVATDGQETGGEENGLFVLPPSFLRNVLRVLRKSMHQSLS